jgi:hypothetical protein
MSSDQILLVKAVEEAQSTLSSYTDTDARYPEATVKKLMSILNRPEVLSAMQRIRAGYGLRVEKWILVDASLKPGWVCATGCPLAAGGIKIREART